MAHVLADTSAVYALIDRDDSNHRKAANILRSLPRRGITLLLTNFVVAESHALLLSRLEEIWRATGFLSKSGLLSALIPKMKKGHGKLSTVTQTKLSPIRM